MWGPGEFSSMPDEIFTHCPVNSHVLGCKISINICPSQDQQRINLWMYDLWKGHIYTWWGLFDGGINYRLNAKNV
jgi:hypothetical protein